MTGPLLEAEKLSLRFPYRPHPLGPVRGWTEALREVSLRLEPGETVGLVGESGCGKSTLARALLGLVEPSAGEVRFEGRPLGTLDREGRRRFRRSVQMIFQDPLSSLNPTQRVGQIIAEPMAVQKTVPPAERPARAAALLGEVGLSPDLARRFPRALSGGQRQRVGIARALALEPRVLICDEPVSSLDLSVQAQILRLLCDLQRRRGLTLLFISHDLTTVGAVSDRICVMRAGQIIETGRNPELFRAPRHPYTRALVDLAAGALVNNN